MLLIYILVAVAFYFATKNSIKNKKSILPWIVAILTFLGAIYIDYNGQRLAAEHTARQSGQLTQP